MCYIRKASLVKLQSVLEATSYAFSVSHRPSIEYVNDVTFGYYVRLGNCIESMWTVIMEGKLEENGIEERLQFKGWMEYVVSTYNKTPFKKRLLRFVRIMQSGTDSVCLPRQES